jgi:hypothetical protein
MKLGLPGCGGLSGARRLELWGRLRLPLLMTQMDTLHGHCFPAFMRACARARVRARAHVRVCVCVCVRACERCCQGPAERLRFWGSLRRSLLLVMDTLHRHCSPHTSVCARARVCVRARLSLLMDTLVELEAVLANGHTSLSLLPCDHARACARARVCVRACLLARVFACVRASHSSETEVVSSCAA